MVNILLLLVVFATMQFTPETIGGCTFTWEWSDTLQEMVRKVIHMEEDTPWLKVAINSSEIIPSIPRAIDTIQPIPKHLPSHFQHDNLRTVSAPHFSACDRQGFKSKKSTEVSNHRCRKHRNRKARDRDHSRREDYHKFGESDDVSDDEDAEYYVMGGGTIQQSYYSAIHDYEYDIDGYVIDSSDDYDYTDGYIYDSSDDHDAYDICHRCGVYHY